MNILVLEDEFNQREMLKTCIEEKFMASGRRTVILISTVQKKFIISMLHFVISVLFNIGTIVVLT